MSDPVRRMSCGWLWHRAPGAPGVRVWQIMSRGREPRGGRPPPVRANVSYPRMDDDPARAERFTTEFLATYYGGGVHSRGTMGWGPRDVVIEALSRYAAAGVTDLCLRFVGDDPQAQLERFTAEVLPALRAC